MLRCTKQDLTPFLLAFAVIAFAGCSRDGGDTERSGVERQPAEAVPPHAESESDDPVVLFFGNSITAGYGLDASQAFPALVQAKIDEAGINARVVNAGNSGETSAGGLRRINWFMDQPIDVFVLELGGNDGLRGHPVEEIRSNLQAIIDTVEARHPDAEIAVAGMQIPPNLGASYAEAFRGLFATLADANDAVLIPFLLQDVAGRPDLNLPDGIHPNARGHALIAETVWKTIGEMINEE